MLKVSYFFKKFRFKSILTKTFISLILLSLVLVVVFNYFTINIISNYYRDQTDDSNLAMLSQSSKIMNNTLTILSQNMEQFMWNPTMVTQMIMPLQKDIERDSNILGSLKSYCSSMSNIVSGGWFYLPMIDKIYTSFGTIITASDINSSEALSAIINDKYPGKDVIGQDKLYLRYIDSRLYVIKEFPVMSRTGTNRNRLGVMIYSLNLKELYSIICGSIQNEGQTYVFDTEGNDIFGKLDTLKSGQNIDISDTDIFLIKKDISSNKANKKYYLFESYSQGLIYIRERSEAFPILEYIPIALPSLVILFLISLLFSVYLSIHIYQPINRLMSKVVNSKSEQIPLEEGDKTYKNEADYLEMAYTDALDKSGKLSGLMDKIAPAVLEHIFRCLIFGRELDDKYIADTLSGIGNPVRENDSFIVLLGSTGEAEDISLTGLESSLYYLSIKNTISNINNKDHKAILIPNARYTATIVIWFAAEMTDNETEQTAEQMFYAIQKDMQGLPFPFVLGKGQIHKGIKNLAYSFEEAQSALSYSLYYNNSSDEKADNSILNESNNYHFSLQMKMILQKVSDGHEAEALEMADRLVLSVINKEKGNVAQAKIIFEALTDEIMGTLISLLISKEDLVSLKKMQTDLYTSMFYGAEELTKPVLCFFRDAIALMSLYRKKNQYRYIIKAKEYIDSNYMDSSLSLYSISRSIGINSSYLSELFSEVTGENYLNYLNSFRVNKSKLMLESTSLTIKDIGFKCGFNSIQNFIRVFRKFTQTTPGQYRDDNPVNNSSER